MHADIIPLIVGLLILLSAFISLRLAVSVAIIEILLGALAGSFGLKTEDWMSYIATFGGVLLTYLAGTEIDTKLIKENFKQCFLIGVLSFLIPFAGVFVYTFFFASWEYRACLIAGTALSTTSLAVVYSVLVETGLGGTETGKLVMAATFVTDMGTALALSIMFLKPTLYTLIFISVSINVIFLANKFSEYILKHPKFSNHVIEPEIKYIFVLLLIFMYFANLGQGHAVLPAFVLGLVMSREFNGGGKTLLIRNRIRTVAYAFITPLFFIVGGLNVSLPLIAAAIGMFVILFFLKMVTKFIGVYFLAKRYIPNGSMYTTLLMSTGLTFGTIASVFGLNSGFINQEQYSVLVGVVVASAVIPTIIAQKWFRPVHSEDVVEE
jgi:Kef-type K+ transport system membrane component KefB